jgi:recombination protein RecT
MNDKALMRQEEKVLREQLEAMRPQFEAALHGGMIKPERFVRVVMTAVNMDPDLLAADRRSFFNSCLQCAQDGLVPDKREAALVVFNTKERRGNQEQWIKKIQYMPMYQGLMKKARTSGELAKWVARAVFEKDHFHVDLGDNERIEHTPYMGDDDPGPLKAVYAIAILKDGTVQREVMTRRQVERVKARSKTGAKDSGPWKTDYDQMAIKTVIRRQSKQLPLSPALMEIITRDDALTALDEEPAAEETWRDVTPPRPRQEDFAEEPQPEPDLSTDDQAADDAPSNDGPKQEAAKKKAAPKAEPEPQADPAARWKIETDAMSYLATFKAMLRHTKGDDDVNAMLGVNSERIAALPQETQDAIYAAANERKEKIGQ